MARDSRLRALREPRRFPQSSPSKDGRRVRGACQRHRRRGEGDDTDRGKSARFDRQATATDSASFPGLFPTKVSYTVYLSVSFHHGAMQSGITFLVSIKMGPYAGFTTAEPVWKGPVSVPCAPCLWHASVWSDRSRERKRIALRLTWTRRTSPPSLMLAMSSSCRTKSRPPASRPLRSLG